ncbi:MAG: glycosyltransferase family 39 protein [Chloroflexota bacterium]
MTASVLWRFGASWWTGFVVLGLAALAPRLVNLGSFSGKGDEGIRAEQLLLMARGFRPVRDVFASQGPLSLDIFLPFYLALDQTLAGARLAVAVYSTLAVLATYWVGRRAAGPAGGWLSAGLLLASPTFLANSRLALVEIPSLLPATVAVACLLEAGCGARRAWMAVSAVALAVALCIKPMMLPVVPALGLLLLMSPSRGWREILVYAAVAAVTMAVIVSAYSPAVLFDQVVRYRLGAARAEGWSFVENRDMLWGVLRDDGWGIVALAVVGAVVVCWRTPKVGIPLVVWALGTLGLLLIYTPLGTKHAALQPLPTSLVAGTGLAGVMDRLWAGPARMRLVDRLLGTASLLALFVWLAWLPPVWGELGQALSAGDAGAEPPYRDESLLIQYLTRPEEFILVDDPYLAFLNGRAMPPRLVDTSIFRIRSGTLTGAELIEDSERYGVRLMHLVSDNLRQIKKFRDWVDEAYQVVRIDERSNRKDRALYVLPALVTEETRSAIRSLRPYATYVDAEFDGQVRLRSVAVDRLDLRPGGSTGITFEWELVAATPVDWHPVVSLRDERGRSMLQDESSLGGGSGGTATWQPGRWVFKTAPFQVTSRTAPGRYTLAVGLYDSRARRMAQLTAGSPMDAEQARLVDLTVR